MFPIKNEIIDVIAIDVQSRTMQPVAHWLKTVVLREERFLVVVLRYMQLPPIARKFFVGLFLEMSVVVL